MLTAEQRDAGYAEGANKRCRRRLGDSGRLTGQQDFVGRNCAKGQRERGVLFNPLKPEKNQEVSKAHKPELITEVTQSSWLRDPQGRLAGHTP